MRAAVLPEPGRAPAWSEHPDPSPAAGHTLVAVTAAPIVPLDQLCASGTSYFGRPATPYVPGVQGVGVVERSDALPQGARVFFSTTAGMAPWMCLPARAQLLPGERVLVLGGGGAVGQAAIGAAKVLGAGRVVAVARSPEAQERARLAGADEVLPLTGDVDHLTARFQDAVGGSVNVVIDPVFGIAASAAARVLAERGRLVNLGGSSGDVAEFSSAVLRSRTADVLGYTNAALTPAERRAALAAVIEHAAAGRMAVAHEVLPLAQVDVAWRRQAEGKAGVRLVPTP